MTVINIKISTSFKDIEVFTLTLNLSTKKCDFKSYFGHMHSFCKKGYTDQFY